VVVLRRQKIENGFGTNKITILRKADIYRKRTIFKACKVAAEVPQDECRTLLVRT
jgi:hypothetical protein